MKLEAPPGRPERAGRASLFFHTTESQRRREVVEGASSPVPLYQNPVLNEGGV